MSDFKLKGHLAMLGANTMWGLMSPITKLVLTTSAVTPLLMVDFRIAGAAALFWLTSLFCPREHVPPRVLLLLAEPITLKKAGGIALGACGALILVFGGLNTGLKGDNPALGDFIVLCAQLSYALYLTLYRNFIRKYSLVTLMKWMFLFAACGTIPAAMPQMLRTDWTSLTTLHWAGIAYVVVFATYLAYICIMIGQKNLRPTIVGMYNYVQPVVASLIGVCLGLDSFNVLKGFAVVLIFSGVYLVTISKAAPAPTQK